MFRTDAINWRRKLNRRNGKLMKTKDVFTLAVRLLGLWVLYQAISLVTGVGSLLWEALMTLMYSGIAQFGSAFVGLLQLGWFVAVALWLIRGAPWLLRLAYPEQAELKGGAVAGVSARAADPTSI
jgi:hypothetical protein